MGLEELVFSGDVPGRVPGEESVLRCGASGALWIACAGIGGSCGLMANGLLPTKLPGEEPCEPVVRRVCGERRSADH